MRTPLPRHFPAQSGAITGLILPDGESCPVDEAEAVNSARSILRIADFHGYRHGNRRPIQLGEGGYVIAFRAPLAPNVILFPRKPDVPPTPSAPAMPVPMLRAA